VGDESRADEGLRSAFERGSGLMVEMLVPLLLYWLDLKCGFSAARTVLLNQIQHKHKKGQNFIISAIS